MDKIYKFYCLDCKKKTEFEMTIIENFYTAKCLICGHKQEIERKIIQLIEIPWIAAFGFEFIWNSMFKKARGA